MNENEIRVHVVDEPDRTNLSMRYLDPVTGRQSKRSTGTTDLKEARKKAAQWEADLNEGRYHAPLKTTWDQFRDRYQAEHLATLAEGTQDRAALALNMYEEYMRPRLLSDVTASRISTFQSRLRTCRAVADTTIAANLRHVKAALRWAESIGIMVKAPKVAMPKRAKGAKLMKGRPITAEEYERILDVVPQVRQHDAEAWQRYLTGLWLSGLRLAESILLSWDDDSPIAVDLGGKHPRFRIHGSAQKSGQDQLLPMTPDFAEWLLRTPRGDRTGRVFVLNNLRNGEPLAHGVIGRIVTRIGEKAGVVVNREGKKVKETVEKQVRGKIRKVPTGRLVEEEVTRFASAHDYCRAFGTRWARKVMPATLQLLMRHASIATTMAYYVDLGTDEIADDLWAKHSPETNAGTILGTIDDPPPPLISPPRLAVSPYPERSTGGGS